MKKLSRLESNKEVRRVLIRHSADLGQCQYSCSGFEVRLTGWLCKIDGSEYQTFQIENIIQDFQRRLKGYLIQGDLDNWNFTSDSIKYIAEKKKEEIPILPEDDENYEDAG
jgi:hypothetical protein